MGRENNIGLAHDGDQEYTTLSVTMPDLLAKTSLCLRYCNPNKGVSRYWPPQSQCDKLAQLTTREKSLASCPFASTVDSALSIYIYIYKPHYTYTHPDPYLRYHSSPLESHPPQAP
jgi:hypothetical protein